MMTTAELIGLVLGAVLSSTVVAELIKGMFNSRKNGLEADHVIVQMYDKLLEDLRAEVGRMKDEIKELRAKETAYMENQNIWLSRNNDLMRRIEDMEKINREQSQKIQELEKELAKFA